MDAGGGALARLGASRLEASELDALLLTHLHPDHVGEVAPQLWALWVAVRDRALTIVGPAGRDGAGGLKEWAAGCCPTAAAPVHPGAAMRD